MALMNDIFASYREYINSEQELREKIKEKVKEIDQSSRELATILQNIHTEEGIKNLSECCIQAKALFPGIQQNFSILASLIPSDQYYRFNDHWRFIIQRLCFLIALIYYLESGHLVSREECANMLGVKAKREFGFHLDLEDYLMGLLQMASELARFAVNSVTCGNYTKPLEISKFVSELSAGFRLLNLKNDVLRKRYDALKYDVKKIEEVVYDLSIRGLKLKPSEAEAAEAGDNL